MATKKSSPAGRLGARYGTRIRKNVSEIEKIQKKKHRCPVCTYDKVKRESTSIWVCRKCGAKFAGGAFKPKASITKVFAAGEGVSE